MLKSQCGNRRNKVAARSMLTAGLLIASVATARQNPPVAIYPNSAKLCSRSSLARSLNEALHEARGAWGSTGDIYRAIAIVNQSCPIPGAVDLRSLPLDVQRGLAWYAGLLISTERGTADGMALLRNIHASLPQNGDISALMQAAIPWEVALTGGSESTSKSLAPVDANLVTGVLPGAIASSPRYLVAARWCGSPDSGAATTLLPIRGTVEPLALDDCYSGATGVGIYDPANLKIRAFVPITVSGPEIQEYVGSVAVLGHLAYATIDRRFAENGPRVVAIDLDKARIVAKSNAGPYSQIRVIGHALAGCTGSFDFPSGSGTCWHLDPSNLRPEQTFEDLTAPNPFMPDSALNELVRRGLGRYAHDTLAVTDQRLLIRQPRQFDSLGIVDWSRGAVTRVPGEFAITVGFGATSADGRYTYLVDTPSTSAPADERLTRVDMRGGAAVDLADGPIMSLSLSRFGPLLAYVTGSRIQVRDARTGDFLCTWPLPTAQTSRIIGAYVARAANSFVLIRIPRFIVNTRSSPTSFQFVSQSLAFDISRFVAESLQCGRQSAAAADGFNRALARVAP